MTVLIGQDNHLPTLVCYHASFSSHKIFLKSESRQTPGKRTSFRTAGEKTLRCDLLFSSRTITGCRATSLLLRYGAYRKISKMKLEGPEKKLKWHNTCGELQLCFRKSAMKVILGTIFATYICSRKLPRLRGNLRTRQSAGGDEDFDTQNGDEGIVRKEALW